MVLIKHFLKKNYLLNCLSKCEVYNITGILKIRSQVISILLENKSEHLKSNILNLQVFFYSVQYFFPSEVPQAKSVMLISVV